MVPQCHLLHFSMHLVDHHFCIISSQGAAYQLLPHFVTHIWLTKLTANIVDGILWLPTYEDNYSSSISREMAGFFTWLWDWLLWMFWATEMDVTIVGLQNAGKTSLVRVLAVSSNDVGETRLHAEPDSIGK